MPEGTILDRLFQITIGRGDDANIDIDGFGAADSFEGVILQNAQKLGLHERRHLAHFIKEQGSPDRPVQTCQASVTRRL